MDDSVKVIVILLIAIFMVIGLAALTEPQYCKVRLVSDTRQAYQARSDINQDGRVGLRDASILFYYYER